MASNQTITKIVKQLLAAPLANKPKPIQGQQYADWLTDLVNVFAETLRDVDDDALLQAARLHIVNSKWFPTIADLRTGANSANFRLAENSINGRSNRSFTAWAKQQSQAWPVCPTCEENTPDLKNCPFCSDMQEALAYNASIGALAL